MLINNRKSSFRDRHYVESKNNSEATEARQVFQ